jgi:hypothetical protein
VCFSTQSLIVYLRLQPPCDWIADPSPDPSFNSHLSGVRSFLDTHSTCSSYPLTGPSYRPRPDVHSFVDIDEPTNSLHSLKHTCSRKQPHSPPPLWKHYWRETYFRPFDTLWTPTLHPSADPGLTYDTTAGRKALDRTREREGNRNTKRRNGTN